jgi:hypothetical protein
MSSFINIHSVDASKSITAHLHKEGITTGTHCIKIVDFSDRVNYKHAASDHISVQWVQVQSDASGISEYSVCFGYAKNVTASSGDFVCVKSWSELRSVGSSFSESSTFPGYGISFHEDHVVSADIKTGVAGLSSTAICSSTLHPDGTDSLGFGNGDIVVYVMVLAGTINLSIECLYN